MPHRHFAARELAGRFPAQGKIRHVKQIAFAIYLTGVLDGDFAPHTLEAHPQVDASVGSLQLAAVLEELRRIEAGNGIQDELLEIIRLINTTLNGLKGQNDE